MKNVVPQKDVRAAANDAAHATALLRALPDLILQLSRAGVVLYYKPPRVAIPGMPGEDIVGQDARQALPVWAAKNLVHIEGVIERGAVVCTEYVIQVGDQSRYHECQLSASHDGTVLAVVRDVTARRQASEQQQRLQTVLIRAQAAAMAELATPLIPIHDRVVVVPLVGVLDEDRAEQVIKSVLEGVVERGAQIVILDITGIIHIEVPDALVRAAKTLQLVGVHTVLTGMRPDVARVLVELDVNLTDIVTRGTLQSGIAYAMSKLSQRADAIG